MYDRAKLREERINGVFGSHRGGSMADQERIGHCAISWVGSNPSIHLDTVYCGIDARKIVDHIMLIRLMLAAMRNEFLC
jgi:hypothetical protein